MKLRLAALVFAATSALAFNAAAQEMPTANRLYWLCKTEDPQCVPLLRQLVRQIIEVNPDCRYYPTSDDRLRVTFLQFVRRDQSILRFSAIAVETQVYSSMVSNCVKRLPPAVAAEMAPWQQRDAERRAAEKDAGPPIPPEVKREITEYKYSDGWCRTGKQAACADRDRYLVQLNKRGWCFGHEPQPLSDRQWEPCQR